VVVFVKEGDGECEGITNIPKLELFTVLHERFFIHFYFFEKKTKSFFGYFIIA
jgi:hypothetical protein